ncbi:YoaK family protein [Leifsonia sp. NPDC058248]|uniref:YoaK family protein n=1 Tax=Leifsonia sp. NPDC058248 TaxID=3346402 RepID=UPI0036DB2794
MSGRFAENWRAIAVARGNPHGPLPLLLVLLTVVTGLVDAFSYLELGHVFVANMTGNVVFLAFALGGTPGFIWWASILAIVTFSIGAFIGGRIQSTYGGHRGRHLLVASAIQAAVFAASFIVALVAALPYDNIRIVILIALLGIGMGLQNATARGLAIPDLTTTVLTLTITGISADSTAAGGAGSKLGRRLVSIVSMFVGALIGVVLVGLGLAPWAIFGALLLLLVVVTVTAVSARSTETWTAKK